MLTREIKRNGEQYLVAITDNGKEATVTDEHGTKVTIRYNSGNLNVRLPNGWGGWQSSMDTAVDYAIKLSNESRGQLTPEEAYKQMAEFVKDEDDKD